MESSSDMVGKTVEGYKIIKFLGRGKFSTVYQAERKKDQKLVALKIIKIYDIKDKDTIEKCLQEVNLLQKVDHPNIVKYIDSFISQNELYIAIEWADKGDVKKLIKKYKQEGDLIEESRVIEYTREIASALDHMHNKRVIHRDLKPANILIFSDGTFKLGDLGLGRCMSVETIRTFSRVGTPLYMAPEVIKKDNGYDFKSDNWSLGCVIYELITLKSPFQTDEKISVMDLFKKISTGQYPHIKDNNYTFSSGIVDSLLKVNPEERAELSDIIAKCQKYLEKIEDKPKIDPFIVMDDIIEKLRLINYENNFCKKYNKELLTKFYFAFSINGYNYNENIHNNNNDGNNNNDNNSINNDNSYPTQFAYFYDLCNWLMIIIKQNVRLEILQEFDIKFKKYDRKKSLDVQLNDLITDLKNMDIKILQNSKFKYGYGEGVCLVLTSLCDKYLIKQNYIFKKPKFKDEIDNNNNNNNVHVIETKHNIDDMLLEENIGTNYGFKANTNYNFGNFKSVCSGSGSKTKFFVGTNKKRFNSAISLNNDDNITTDFSVNSNEDDLKISPSTVILQPNIEPSEWNKEFQRVANNLEIPEVPEYLESESSIKISNSNNINKSIGGNENISLSKKLNTINNYIIQLKNFFSNLNRYTDKIENDLKKISHFENILSKSSGVKNAIGKLNITNSAIGHYESDIKEIQENMKNLIDEKNEIDSKIDKLKKRENNVLTNNDQDKAKKLISAINKIKKESNKFDVEIGLLSSTCFMNAKNFHNDMSQFSIEEKFEILYNNHDFNFKEFDKPVFNNDEII